MAKIQQKSGKICEFLGKNRKKTAIFNENFEIRERSSRPSRGPPRSSRLRRLPLCSRPLRALPAFGAPSGAFRFLSPPRPALDLSCAQVCAKFFVRSGLLAKLFKIYVVVAFSLNFSLYVVGSPLACPLGRLGPLPHPLVSRVSSNHATTLNLVQTPWNFVEEFGIAGNPNKGHSVCSQLDQTEPWYCRRLPSILAACHTAFILVRARG